MAFGGLFCGICNPSGDLGQGGIVGAGTDTIEATTYTELFSTTNPVTDWAMHLLEHLMEFTEWDGEKYQPKSLPASKGSR